MNFTNLRRKVILSTLVMLFSFGNIYASDGDDATIIIDDMSTNTKIGAITNSEFSIVSLHIVNLLNPEQLNEELAAMSCDGNLTDCTYSISNEYLVNGKVYLITLIMTDNTMKQKSFLFTD